MTQLVMLIIYNIYTLYRVSEVFFLGVTNFAPNLIYPVQSVKIARLLSR